jgi:hypothetical protein
MITLLPGDILAVNTHSFWGRFIRLGAWLRGQDAGHDHIVIVYGRDDEGVLWGIEARPNGVGWVPIEKEYDKRSFVANVGQEKTQEQRDFIATNARLMLATKYDWAAIVVSGLDVIQVEVAKVLLQRWHWISRDLGTNDTVPSQIICSSLAVWLTHHAPAPKLSYPDQHGERWTTPADWVDWIKKCNYDHV